MLSTFKLGTSGAPTRLRFRLKAGGKTTRLVADAGDILEGQAAHVAAVYDGKSMRLYLDGVKVGQRNQSGSINADSTAPLWIGGNPPNATDRPWAGGIDDVVVYTRALSDQDIQFLAEGQVPGSLNQAWYAGNAAA